MLQDWVFEPKTASELDFTAPYSPPAYGLPNVFLGLWDNRFITGLAEVAGLSGLSLEGVFEVSESLFVQIQANTFA